MRSALLAALLALAPVVAQAYVPLTVGASTDPARTAASINANFLELAQEMSRRSLKDGGVVNADVKLSSSLNAIGNAVFSSSLTVLGGVFGTINKSTYTLINTNITISATAMAVCLAGSTVTIITDGTRMTVSFDGGIDANAINTGNGTARMGFLVDGGYPTGTTSSLGLTITTDPGLAPFIENIGFRYTTRTALASGSHNFCLVASVEGGSAALSCASVACNFQVEELH